MTVRTRGWLAILASAVLVAGCGNGPKPDENDPWTVVTAYVDAVNASDADAIEALVNPSYDATTEIDSRLARLGGRHLYYETMQFRGSGMDGVTSVELTLRTQSGNATFTDSLPLARSSSRWYIVMGRLR